MAQQSAASKWSEMKHSTPAYAATKALSWARLPLDQSSDFHSDEVFEKYSRPPKHRKLSHFNQHARHQQCHPPFQQLCFPGKPSWRVSTLAR